MNAQRKLIICKKKVSAEQLFGVETPPATESHVPVPHALLVSLAREAVERAGFSVLHEEHGLARNDMNYFGAMALTGQSIESGERQLVFGLRNSHLKQFAASACIGDSVMVCENLAFYSDIKLARRHTTNILADLPRVLADAVGRCVSQWERMGERIQAYKETEVSRETAENLIVSLVDAKAFPARDIYNAVQEFRNPRHEEFKGGTLWTLYNSITENLKGGDLAKLPFRTMTAQSILDRVAAAGRGGNVIEAEIVG